MNRTFLFLVFVVAASALYAANKQCTWVYDNAGRCQGVARDGREYCVLHEGKVNGDQPAGKR